MGSSLLFFSLVASPHTCVTIVEAARPHSALPLHRRLDVNVAIAPEELHPKLKRHITDALPNDFAQLLVGGGADGPVFVNEIAIEHSLHMQLRFAAEQQTGK